MGHDAEYLKEVVGDVLSQGLAEIWVSQPEDPFDALGHWLVNYVSKEAMTKRVQKEFRQQSEAAASAERRRAEEDEAAKEAAIARETCLQELADRVEKGAVSDIYQLWTAATEAVTQWTAIQSAYVGLLRPNSPRVETEPQEEAAEDDAEQENDEPLIPLDATETAGTETAEEDATEAWSVEIVAASDERQRFLLTRVIHKPPLEETDTETASLPVAPVFRLIEEGLADLYIRCCVDAPGIQFLSGFPKIGSCYMCLLAPSTDEGLPKAALICDTLSPPGPGTPISEADRCFVKRVAEIVSKLSPELQPSPLPTQEETREWLETLQQKLQEHQPTADPDATEEQPEAQEETTEEEADEAKKALLEEIKTLSADIKETTTALKQHEALLSKEASILALVVDATKSVLEKTLDHVKKTTQLPNQTLSLAGAALCLLGESEAASSWSSIRGRVLDDLAMKLIALDVEAIESVSSWQATRIALKRFKTSGQKPNSTFDWTLLLCLKQCCRVETCLRQKATTESSLAEKTAQLESKHADLNALETPDSPEEAAAEPESAADATT